MKITNNIRCKFCGHKLGSMIQGCNCQKKSKWKNPVYTRKYKYRTKNKLK